MIDSPTPAVAAPADLDHVLIDAVMADPSPLSDSDSDDVELPSPDAAAPELGRVRPHLIPARPSICIRAPCLKRNKPSSPSVTPPAELDVTYSGASSSSSAGTDEGLVAEGLSQSWSNGDRSVSLAESTRHVHFDESPPQEFTVHPGEKYDRRPIECTQGGSEFDMSLPPRCTSYNGDDDADEPSSPASASSLDGIKNGTQTSLALSTASSSPLQQSGSHYQSGGNQSGLTVCGKSVHSSLYSSMEGGNFFRSSASILASQPSRTPEKQADEVQLPVHGFRSFGGRSKVLSVGLVGEPAEACKSLTGRAKPTISALSSVLSPDATPMPSPSIVHVSHDTSPSSGSGDVVESESGGGGYFALSSVAVGRIEMPAQPSRSASLSLSAVSPPAGLNRNRASEEDLRRLTSDTIHAAEPTDTLGSPHGSVETTLQKPQRTPQGSAEGLPAVANEADDQDATTCTQIASKRPTLVSTWPSGLGFSSPGSSRCSSVDPWSSLSSDGDAEGTDSPSNEASWISSSCTSPELGPCDRSSGSNAGGYGGLAVASGSNGSGKVSPSSSSLSAWLAGEGATTSDEAKFSSSLETVSAVQTMRSAVMSLHLYDSSNGSDSFLSTSESCTPDTSRRPSLQHYEMEALSLSARVKGRKAQHASVTAAVDEEGMVKPRTRSSSRDGTLLRKPKPSKCKFCRMQREREKRHAFNQRSVHDDFAAELGEAVSLDFGSPRASTTSLEFASPSPSPSHSPSPSLAASEGAVESTPTRQSVRSASTEMGSIADDKRRWSRSASRERSLLGMAAPAIDGNEADGMVSDAAQPAPSLKEQAMPTECTCAQKRERDLLRKRLRKEREVERERDREWERDQARGRQRRLFGDSLLYAGDGACLSALDGF